MLLAKLRTIWRLGLRNAINVLAYRVQKSAGLYDLKGEPFEPIILIANSETSQSKRADLECVAIANEFRAGRYRAFGGDLRESGWPPLWHQNILTGEVAEAHLPWWRKAKTSRGDVKGIWELSRFDWALDLAKAHLADPLGGHLAALNETAANWQNQNLPYFGTNWECGQETSLRLLSLLEVVRILGSIGRKQIGLEDFVLMHLKRISATIHYAIAQDNNHGTSEAAALFVGGMYLKNFGTERNIAIGQAFNDTGRKWLENRVFHLIMNDGGFSQYSITYHRLMIDTLASAEQWRIDLGEVPFSKMFYERLRAATHWFVALVDQNTGDAPNLGSNDGAHVLSVATESFRDFRPSLKRAQDLFGSPVPESIMESAHFPEFGLAILKQKNAKGFLRLPSNKFRPAQADLLHLDLWTADGKPIVIDSGSLSYADSENFLNFSSISHHNTVQFDDREPMRRWSRFLFLDWLGDGDLTLVESNAMQGDYRDYLGAKHFRRVEFNGLHIRVIDIISGFKKKAIVRWHFANADWIEVGANFESSIAKLECRANGKIISKELVDKTSSPTYAQFQHQLCLEVEVGPNTTEIISLITIKQS